MSDPFAYGANDWVPCALCGTRTPVQKLTREKRVTSASQLPEGVLSEVREILRCVDTSWCERVVAWRESGGPSGKNCPTTGENGSGV